MAYNAQGTTRSEVAAGLIVAGAVECIVAIMLAQGFTSQPRFPLIPSQPWPTVTIMPILPPPCDCYPWPPAPEPPRSAEHPARPSNSTSTWISTSDYPVRDLRQGNQGVVRFSLSINSQGKVTGCAITQSSGFVGLDDATCKYISRRARFEPATGPDGKSIASRFHNTVRWIVPDRQNVN